MNKQKTSSVKALSRFFTFILLIVICGIGALLFYAFQNLPAYATSVNKKLEQANLIGSENSAQSNEILSARAALFFANPSTIKQQTETDIRHYAQLAGIAVRDISQDSEDLSSFAIQLNSPMPYTSFIQFINAIEGNVPHMSITSIAIERAGAPTSDRITVSSLKIKVASK